VEGIRRLRDFLRIGSAGLEKFWGGSSQAWGFSEDWISRLRAGLEMFCEGNLQSLGFPEDWISSLRDILRWGFKA
jgi:hypothetical protein